MQTTWLSSSRHPSTVRELADSDVRLANAAANQYSTNMVRLTVELHDPRVFWRKVATVALALLVLEPLTYYKLYVSSVVYLSLILALHIIFLYVYVSHIPWRELWVDKQGLLARFIGIVIVGYLLALIHVSQNWRVILVNIVAMSVLHSFILLLLMFKSASLRA